MRAARPVAPPWIHASPPAMPVGHRQYRREAPHTNYKSSTPTQAQPRPRALVASLIRELAPPQILLEEVDDRAGDWLDRDSGVRCHKLCAADATSIYINMADFECRNLGGLVAGRPVTVAQLRNAAALRVAGP